MSNIVKSISITDTRAGMDSATLVQSPIFDGQVGLWGVNLTLGEDEYFLSHEEARHVADALMNAAGEASYAEYQENQPVAEPFPTIGLAAA